MSLRIFKIFRIERGNPFGGLTGRVCKRFGGVRETIMVHVVIQLNQLILIKW